MDNSADWVMGVRSAMISGPMAARSSHPDPQQRLTELRRWFASALGQALADKEQAVLAEHLPDLFGYHLLSVDAPYRQRALESSRISHQVQQSRLPCNGSMACGLEGEAEGLPIQSDSLDAIILPHSLEFCRDPHQVLREADRCLVPEGHLVILGFNPISWWGAWGLVARWHNPMPWRLRSISMNRLEDWLSLLGFDTLHAVALFHRPPLQSQRALERLRFLESPGHWQTSLLAGAYCLVARKRVATLTPIRPRWRPRRGLLGAGVAEPTNRSYHDRG